MSEGRIAAFAFCVRRRIRGNAMLHGICYSFPRRSLATYMSETPHFEVASMSLPQHPQIGKDVTRYLALAKASYRGPKSVIRATRPDASTASLLDRWQVVGGPSYYHTLLSSCVDFATPFLLRVHSSNHRWHSPILSRLNFKITFLLTPTSIPTKYEDEKQ